jgi:DNA-binding MarR family transcriptional regulator
MSLSAEGKLLSEAVVLVFSTNGRLLRAGDELAAPSGLTSSRWQLLGVVDHGPATQSEIARTMGLTRQSVRETATALEAAGMIALEQNPHHRTARRVVITQLGRRRLREVEARQAAWANRAAARLSPARLKKLVAGLREVSAVLEPASSPRAIRAS